MVKRFIAFAISIIYILTLSACTGRGGDITLAPENDTTGGSVTHSAEYAFIFNNVKLVPHAEMASVAGELGDPLAYDESESCLYNGLDKDYAYPGFKLRTYPEKGVDYILSICFEDDSVSTPEGIMLGSTRDEVIAAYGSSYTEDNGSIIYVKGRTELRFRFSESGVSAVEYWAV